MPRALVDDKTVGRLRQRDAARAQLVLQRALVLDAPPPRRGREADVRFMQISIQVADRDPAVIERIKEHNPAIRNGLVMLFSSQDPEVLNTREGKEQLRQDALEEVRSVLEQMTGRGRLENLYFTSFVMQ